MTKALDAMLFAQVMHKNQKRKYTNQPYIEHLAEVAGIVATVANQVDGASLDDLIATAWLHDCVEDQGVTLEEIEDGFGIKVAIGVSGLSDLEKGNRAERKAASRERLSMCSGWIQTIKVADLISNTSSIVLHDPKFAVTYLEEKRLLLDVLTRAHPDLLHVAYNQLKEI